MSESLTSKTSDVGLLPQSGRAVRAFALGTAWAAVAPTTCLFWATAGLWHIQATGIGPMLQRRGLLPSYDGWYGSFANVWPWLAAVLFAAATLVAWRRAVSGQRFVRLLALPIICSLGLLVATASVRFMALPILLAAIVVQVLVALGRRRAWVAGAAWTVVLALTLAPIDISLRRDAGPSRFVPVVAGLLTGASAGEQERGVVYTFPCPGFSTPTSIWVW